MLVEKRPLMKNCQPFKLSASGAPTNIESFRKLQLAKHVEAASSSLAALCDLVGALIERLGDVDRVIDALPLEDVKASLKSASYGHRLALNAAGDALTIHLTSLRSFKQMRFEGHFQTEDFRKCD
jgi:hypothetical protein